MSGLFISFEGIEGCGKSTQLEQLYERIHKSGWPCVKTKEPGGTPLGAELRRLLLSPHPSGENWDPVAEALIFYADRAQHLAKLIFPALERNQIVLVDRFLDSTRAYQGAQGASLQVLDRLQELVLGNFLPHLTLLLDLEVEEGLTRVQRRNKELRDFSESRYDEAKRSFHQRVRENFLALAQSEPKRIQRIDASGTPDQVAEAIWKQVEPLLASLSGRI